MRAELTLVLPSEAHAEYAVWAGALTGTGCAIIVGIVIIIVFYTASGSVFNGDGKIVFESFLFLIASYLLTVMAFAMFKFKDYEKKWEMKLAAGASHQVGHLSAFFSCIQ